MNCCTQCEGIENMFDRKVADDDLREYQRKGAAKQTRLLLDTLRQAGVEGLTLLDIGGGVGVIQHELFKSGIQAATDVDASSAYLTVAREEAARRGHADRVRFVHGNFVELAPEIDSADIVTLDRVICCFPDVEAMVSLSAARAGKWYGLIYPRDTWWMRLGERIGNFFLALTRNKYRFFVHSTEKVDALARQSGLKPHYRARATLFWQVVVYGRS
jgi:SAM-dependent methyltransferase